MTAALSDIREISRRVAVLRWLVVGACALWSGVSVLRAIDLDIPVFAGAFGTAFYEESARLYERDHPGVHVRIYGDPRIADQIRVRVIGGDYPDAASSGLVYWPAIIHAGRLMELSEALAGPDWEGRGRWVDRFLPGTLDSWKVEGGIYGIPVAYSCWSIFYDRKFFREHGFGVPRTWDDFFALCAKIRAAGRAPLSVPGIYLKYADGFLRAAYYNLVGPAGWSAYVSLAPGARSDPRFVRAAAVMQRLKPWLSPGWEGMTHTSAQRALLDGQAAMNISGSWMISEMQGHFPPGFELGVMNFPSFADGVADPTVLQTQSDDFFVFRTGHPERERLTIDFLRYLTSRERSEAFVRALDAPVSVRGVPESAYSPMLRGTAELIAHSRGAVPVPPYMTEAPGMIQALTDMRLRLMRGEITPEEFARRMESAAEGERARAVDPDRINVRHPVAGTVLLCALAAAGAWLGWSSLRSRPQRGLSARAHSARAEGAFGPLRPGMGAVFVGPALLLFGALAIVPAATSFTWAFVRWDGIGPRSWVGLFNFKWLLFETDLFWYALANNAYLVIVPALIVIPLALALAGLIHRSAPGARGLRAVVLFPNLLGGIAAALLWMSAYEPHGGLVNTSLAALGRTLHLAWLQGFADYPWLAQRHLYGALVPIYMWLGCGFNLILFLAAMEGIDPHLYEAAAIDGASPLRQFFALTIPLIWEVIVISAVFMLIGGLNAFELIWLLTSQDPSATVQTLGTFLVTSMFSEFQTGRATAIAVLLFVLVLASVGLLQRLFRREAIES